MEGLLSGVLLSSDLIRESVVLERVHTQYDPDLGWAPIPDLHIPDMYGPGVFLRTNSDGFRGPYNYTESIPAGKRRLICSGDSVTFGYGVDDDHSWCRLLETIDPRLQTINMALPGYGVDQAYLWYKRDAQRFDHQIHVFAPITDDLRRMQGAKFNGYGRPFLVVNDGRLAVTNVPVPPESFRLPWLTEVRRHVWSLRSAEAVRRVRRLAQGLWNGDAEAALPVSGADRVAADDQTALVVGKLLQDLQALNRERGSVLVVVYLPTFNDRGPDTQFWTRVLAAECQRLSIPFVNLVPLFQQMPPVEVAALYLPNDLGHFNEKGNRYVAQLIHQHLVRIPETSRALLDTGGPPREARLPPPARAVSRE